MRHTRIATARVQVSDERGQTSEGFSSDLLVPKWFDKDPTKSAEDNVADLVASAEAAAKLAVRGSESDTAFGHWCRMRANRRRAAARPRRRWACR